MKRIFALLFLFYIAVARSENVDEADSPVQLQQAESVEERLGLDDDDLDLDPPLLKPLTRIHVNSHPQAPAVETAAVATEKELEATLTGSSKTVGVNEDSGNNSKRTWGASATKPSPVEQADKPGIDTDAKHETKNEKLNDDSADDAEKEAKRPWGIEDVNIDDDDLSGLDNVKGDGGSPEEVESNKRIWGATENATKSMGEKIVSDSLSTPEKAPPIPFAIPQRKDEPSHSPPDGFVIKARVYIDPADKLAHIGTDLPHIPYWDCGVTGSTTSPLPLKNAYFRHALSGSTYWDGTDGRHAVIMVALRRCLLELNSGETMTLAAGDLVLLEDVLKPGHKVKPLEQGDISVLFLTLPQPYYYTGKEHLSLPSSFVAPSKRINPCPSTAELVGAAPSSSSGSMKANIASMKDELTTQQTRTIFLAILGLSVSTIAVDFLGRTAPLWLAVGIGGTSFVAGGTWAITKCGNALLTSLDELLEKRKLEMIQDEDETTSLKT